MPADQLSGMEAVRAALAAAPSALVGDATWRSTAAATQARYREGQLHCYRRVVGGHHDARAKVTPELVSRPARVVPLTRGGGSRRVSRAVGLMHGRRLAAAAEDGRDPQLGARGRG